jgi:Spy/CpxP family protein refolding chaperone
MKLIQTSLIASLAIALVGSVAAEDKTAPAPASDKPAAEAPRAPRGGRGRLNPEELIQRMTESLKLDQEQQKAIKKIFDENALKLKELMDKGFQNLTEEDRIALREMMKTQRAQIDDLLTDEQKEKAEAEMAKRRAKMGERRRRHEAPPEVPKS